MTQLILIPGLASDHVMWQAQLAALPAHHRAHVTDVATRHDSIETMATALLAEHPGDLILCGASMGGIVAMQAAHQGGDRIRGLALLGTNARARRLYDRVAVNKGFIRYDHPMPP